MTAEGWLGQVLAEQHAAKLEELLEGMPEEHRPSFALLTGCFL